MLLTVHSSLWPLLVLFLVSNAYGTSVLFGVALLKQQSFFEGSFSSRKYYLLMGWAPLTYLGLALLLDPRYALFFVTAAALGVIGELLVSIHFRSFFREPIWTYSHSSILSGYTATINILPWAVGALLFHVFGRLIFPAAEPPPVDAMLTATVAVLGGVALSLALRSRTSARTGQLSVAAFAVFCLPIATSALALGLLCDARYPLVMAIFSLVGFSTEYGYGRSMALFFDRALWTYNHWPIDEGHSSFVTFPLWALGGLYFHFIAVLVGL